MSDPATARPTGESRWPMASAVLVLIVLIILPPYAQFGVAFVIAAVAVVLLVGLVIADPGRIDDPSPRARHLSVALIAYILLVALVTTGVLVNDLIVGSPLTENAGLLLFVGGKVWFANNIAFALLYWQFDRGGPVDRAFGRRPHPDFQFPQDTAPELAPQDWRPRFVDYLYVAFTTANAFSPTDTPPLTGWAKLAMGVQALISFLLVGLVIARAVGAFQ